MGDPRRLKKKYSKPQKMWSATRIESETSLLKEYGLKNRSELWRTNHQLKNFQIQAKRLLALKSAQAEKERNQLMSKLRSLGVLDSNSDLNAVLGLTVNKILDRRLQTVVFRKKLAKSLKQSRQFITHEHIYVGAKKITVPSYLVGASEEAEIKFTDDSAFADENHPERFKEKVVVPESVPETKEEEDGSSEKA